MVPMISAANVAPDFSHRQRLVADDLKRLSDPCVLFEHAGRDDDGAPFYVYTVGGWLDGHRLADGCTVAGEVMVISARDREEADYLAGMGLQDTIESLRGEEAQYQEANAALARLASVGHAGRMEAAMKPDGEKNPEFIADADAIRPLIGDDLILSTGTKPTD